MATAIMRILIRCTGNSCRSQMAEGYLRHFAGGGAEVVGAGAETHGAPRWRRVRIDLSGRHARSTYAWRTGKRNTCRSARLSSIIFASTDPYQQGCTRASYTST